LIYSVSMPEVEESPIGELEATGLGFTSEPKNVRSFRDTSWCTISLIGITCSMCFNANFLVLDK
jgi:hypothetical protein